MQDEATAAVDTAEDTAAPAHTNFTATAVINAIAGNPTNAGWDAIEKQIKLIKDELKELDDGITARDIHELRDGIQDVLFTVYGLAHRAGIDADLDYAEVVRSNMTKFDDNDEDATRTRAKYLAIGVETVIFKLHDPSTGRVYYVTKSAKDQTGSDNKGYPKGKWLKSFRFEEPQYAPLPEDVYNQLVVPAATAEEAAA
jgi:NTP pyrophosphatase (non-canonical NTP hydrolase)